MLEKVAESSNGGGMDKRQIGALLLELSLTVVGYYILYQSAKSLIGMIDPTKKDKDSVAQVRGCGCRAGSVRGTTPCIYCLLTPFMRLNAMRCSAANDPPLLLTSGTTRAGSNTYCPCFRPTPRLLATNI